jgi:hypothetical protein
MKLLLAAALGVFVAQSSSHIVIPFLANASKPADLDFQGGECDVDSSDASGNTMECTFQQVFLTTTGVAPDTCMITTSRYQRTFRREAAPGRASQAPTSGTSVRWVSTEGPEGDCGLLDVATLQYEGGVKWTMEMRKTATKRDAACRAQESDVETLSWQNVRRALPCRFVQPGGLSR